MPNRTPPPPDSTSAPLDQQKRSQYVRFDPTLNTGHVIQIAVLVIGGFVTFAALRTDQAQTKADLDQVKAVALVESAQTKATLADIRSEMKEQGKTLGDLKEGIAILRGRAAEPRSGK